MPETRPCWDVFCNVVDNYGDIGVAWRLARQLTTEHGLAVRLFVDDLGALARIAPEIDTTASAQRAGNVDVQRWNGVEGELAADPAQVIIEAFGCGLPATYLEKTVRRGLPPVWINLEYLSAEAWIEGCHGLASRHPTLPLTRHFFFPGFTAESGGLLRERDLFARRDGFRADASARSALWQMLGLGTTAPGALVVSLFCYADAPLASLLDAWAHGGRPILCLVPDGVASAALERWSGSRIHAGRRLLRGNLALAGVPFVAQDDYDRLLWSCDVNFVRGEDSFVRAQWAASPMIWQAYPQAGNTHRLKHDAFLARYAAGLSPDSAMALRSLSTAWNAGGDAGAAWQRFAAARSELETHARAWADALEAHVDLAAALVKFCSNRV
jgi:uncharacterized repeat protein (TIGR03837 family)